MCTGDATTTTTAKLHVLWCCHFRDIKTGNLLIVSPLYYTNSHKIFLQFTQLNKKIETELMKKRTEYFSNKESQ